VSARLKTSLVVSGLIRAVSAAGGFATVLKKGDADAGAILIVIAEKGQISGLFERVLAASGNYEWVDSLPQLIEKKAEIPDWLDRRRARDPDLWVVELDIADAQRFIPRLPSNA
jgi:hypothetical protein